MNEKDLKKQIVNESKLFVPDIKKEIMDSVNISNKKNEKNRSSFFMKLSYSSLFIIIALIVSAILLLNKPNELISNTFIMIDINPSIELEIDDNNKLLNARPLNFDATLILDQVEELIGKDILEVIDYIVQSATELGYVDVNSDSVLISTINENKTKEEKVTLTIKEHFKTKNYIEIEQIPNDITEKANEYNVSPGKYLLIDRVLEKNSNLKLEDLINKSVKELNQLVRDYKEAEIRDFESKYGEKINQFTELKNQAVNDYLRENQEIINEINQIKTRIEEKESLDSIIASIDDFVTRKYGNYQHGKLRSYHDCSELMAEIERKLTKNKDQVINFINDKFETQLRLFKEKLKDDFKAPDINIDLIMNFDFDTDFEFEIDTGNEVNDQEKEVLNIVNRMNVLMDLADLNNSQGERIIRQLKDLKNEYDRLITSDTVRDSFKESETIKNFETRYSQFINDNQKGKNGQ